MAYNRLPRKDPRTIAREIPGIFEVIFPQLTTGVVSYFNKKATHCSDLQSVEDSIADSTAYSIRKAEFRMRI